MAPSGLLKIPRWGTMPPSCLRQEFANLRAELRQLGAQNERWFAFYGLVLAAARFHRFMVSSVVRCRAFLLLCGGVPLRPTAACRLGGSRLRLHGRGAPISPLPKPPLPTVAPLLRRGYGESGCGLRPRVFYRLRQCRFTRVVLAVASTASWASWVDLFGRGFAPASRRHRQKGTLAQMPAQLGWGVTFRYIGVHARQFRFTSRPCPVVRAFFMRQLHPRCPRRLRRATPAAPAFHDIATRGFLHRGRGLFKLRRRRCGCPPLVEQFETFPSATM